MSGGDNKYCTFCEFEHSKKEDDITKCKYCSGCDAHHPINEFGNSKQTADGKECQCIAYRSKRKQEKVKAKLKEGTFKKYVYDDEKICNNKNCEYDGEAQPIENFWLKSKKTGQREARCSKCFNEGTPFEKRDDLKKKIANTTEEIAEAKKINRNKLNAYYRNRRKTDIDFKLKQYIRGRIGGCLRKAKTTRKGKIKYLGIDVQTYKLWLESQFKDGMSWKNYGKVWHIDHVLPCALFTFKDAEDDAIYECFNWKNTRPLFGPENHSKSDKLIMSAVLMQMYNVNQFIICYEVNESPYGGINKKFYMK